MTVSRVIQATSVAARGCRAGVIAASAGESLPWLFRFDQKLAVLPAAILALNGTYTRNSAKTVVHDGALVTLSANQFGTSYDDVTGLYGYVPEPAATNLATYSDGAASTYTVSNVSDGTAVPGFSNGLAFGNNSAQRSATKSISVTSGTVYSISTFIIMDDGNAPVLGAANNTGDLSITLNGVIATATLVRLVGSGVYRVSASITASATASHGAGVTKYTGQSARSFRVTGIQVETGLRATSYIATTSSTASRAADVLSIPLRVNNLLDSQDGSTSNWTRGNCAVTTSGTAPNGTSTAQLATASLSGVVTLYQNSTKAPAAVVTYSVYVKQGNKSTCYLLLRNTTTSTNFTAGVLTFATGAITGTGWSATDVGNGWFRCVFTQATGISVGDVMRPFIHFAGSGTDTSGDTVYFWGAQIEPGSTATTYRPTTSTLKSVANRNIPGFDSDGYTLFADFRSDVSGAAARGVAEINDITISNRVYIAVQNNDLTQCTVVSGSVGQAGIVGGNVGKARGKAAISCSANSFLQATNSVASAPDTSGSMPVSPLTLNIGTLFTGSLPFNGFIFSAGLIPQVLTQAQINGLTTL